MKAIAIEEGILMEAAVVSPPLEHLDVEELLREIERYLEAVETFRAEGCEPEWQS